jgi:hypothetical protein
MGGEMRVSFSVAGFDEVPEFEVSDLSNEHNIANDCAARFWESLSGRERANWQTSGYYNFIIFVMGVPIKTRKIAVEVEPHFDSYYSEEVF